MPYRLRMSGEIHDWLTGLREADPAAALLVGQALAALIGEGASLGPPLVMPVAETWPEDLAAALDTSYQHRLDRLQEVRKRVAEAAWLVKDLQDQIDELESARARLEDRRRRALEAGRKDDTETAGRQRDAAERDITQVRQLVELRPGAPGQADITLIVGLEPPGTAIVIAVPEGREAARDQYRDAVLLSADVLLEARAGEAPEASAHAGVATLAAYIEALGGRLELTAEFGGNRVILR